MYIFSMISVTDGFCQIECLTHGLNVGWFLSSGIQPTSMGLIFKTYLTDIMETNKATLQDRLFKRRSLMVSI